MADSPVPTCREPQQRRGRQNIKLPHVYFFLLSHAQGNNTDEKKNRQKKYKNNKMRFKSGGESSRNARLVPSKRHFPSRIPRNATFTTEDATPPQPRPAPRLIFAAAVIRQHAARARHVGTTAAAQQPALIDSDQLFADGGLRQGTARAQLPRVPGG